MTGHGARRQERGMALLALLAVVVLGASWFMVSRLNAESGGAAAVVQARNAAVLMRAKQALIGYIAAQAVKQYENNPGALPCPEAPGYYASTTQDGQTASSCTLPSVGRFPWRTIGTEKLVDASGEPLWYVVSTGWAYTGTNTTINSDSLGQLTVDGNANDAVALIIAPGPAFTVPSATGCTAWTQTRSTSGTPDWRNYLECENATNPADAAFVTTGPSKSFNDQVMRVTVADIMPAIEAAIANRIEREIVPALNTVYTPSAYGFTGTKPLYPYAATWTNGTTSPGPGTGTSSYLGVDLNYAGLLPFNYTNCTASASNPRCLPSLIAWQGTPANAVEVYGFGYIQTQTCSWQSSGDMRECSGEYHEYNTDPTKPIRIEMTATLNNVAMGLRMLDTTKITVEAKDDTVSGPWESQAVSYTMAMNNGSVGGKPRGSVTITFGATLPNIDTKGWGSYADFRIRIYRTAMGDHTLLDTANATTGWFARNQWYRQTYYAVASGHTAGTVPPTCTTAANCLTVSNVTPTAAQRAILILGGRSINATSRPSSTLANYFESGNATGAFTRNPITNSPSVAATQRFNDRVVVIGSN
jgi:hypothetical protein